jgi:hypothetical protein
MGDDYTVGDEDGLAPDLICVRDTIARELYAQLPLRREAIRQEDIPGVAYAITVLLDRLQLLDLGRPREVGRRGW